MPKVDPETGQPITDDPDQPDEDLAGGKGGLRDPESGDDEEQRPPYEQQVTGH